MAIYTIDRLITGTDPIHLRLRIREPGDTQSPTPGAHMRRIDLPSRLQRFCLGPEGRGESMSRTADVVLRVEERSRGEHAGDEGWLRVSGRRGLEGGQNVYCVPRCLLFRCHISSHLSSSSDADVERTIASGFFTSPPKTSLPPSITTNK
jgi:hypothetical protein